MNRSLFRSQTVRPPACLGCYSPDADEFVHQLGQLFTAPGGPGLLGLPGAIAGPPLRALLVPHMDYVRGGVTYGWGYRELFARCSASLFVIIATSHYSRHRFTLTRQDFWTPLGVVPTDQEYVERLVRHYGPGLFDDPQAHRPEHSIELEVVLLQYLYHAVRPIRIVPLLVGSFHDSIYLGTRPCDRPDIARMLSALREAEAETQEPVCYIISGDLAHIGPKFDDPHPVTIDQLDASKRGDEALIERLEAADRDGFFGQVAGELDARRICGLSPAYTALSAAQPKRGRLLHYGRYVHPRGHESVSFASVVFES